MHYEIRKQDASSSDPPTTSSTVTRRLPKEDRVPAEGGAPGRVNSPRHNSSLVREEGRHCHI